MIRRKATVFRLYPTPDQVSQMAQISGVPLRLQSRP